MLFASAMHLGTQECFVTCLALLLCDSVLAALSFASRLLEANLFCFFWVQMLVYVCREIP